MSTTGDARGYPEPPEAEVASTEEGGLPQGEGWFVLNATEAPWWVVPGYGRAVNFEPDEPRFETFGLNIHVLDPGEPNCRYHAESNQEDFLILAGECILVVEGEERRLRQWDFVHCAPWTRHVFVGTGDAPCVILMAGGRDPDEGLHYPVDEVARRHRAGVAAETTVAKEAYADLQPPSRRPYRRGDLPGA